MSGFGLIALDNGSPRIVLAQFGGGGLWFGSEGALAYRRYLPITIVRLLMRHHSGLRSLWIVLLASTLHAGSGGISPSNGTYAQTRTDPPPATHVADTRFTSSGGDNFASTNIVNGGTATWTKDQITGKYENDITDQKMCVYATSGGTPPYTYEYKSADDVVMSSGDLEP